MKQRRDEEFDLPFVGNDMNDSPATMDKPLDTADAPGRADSELVEDGLPQRNMKSLQGGETSRRTAV